MQPPPASGIASENEAQPQTEGQPDAATQLAEKRPGEESDEVVVDAPLVRAFNLLREFCLMFEIVRCAADVMGTRNAFTDIRVRDLILSGKDDRARRYILLASLSHRITCKAEQLRNLGWRDYLNIDLNRDRRKFVLRYWM